MVPMDTSWSWSASRGSDVLVLNKVLSSSNAMRCVPVAARCFCTAPAPLFLREGVGAVAFLPSSASRAAALRQRVLWESPDVPEETV